MTAVDTLELEGFLEKFEAHTNGHFRFHKGDDLSEGITLSYPHWHIPPQGKHNKAMFDLAVSFTPERQGIDEEQIPEVSTDECQADLVEVG